MRVELRSLDGQSSISLTEGQADDFGVKVAMAVKDGDFAGAYDEVWFFRDAFAAFIRALSQFTVDHDGEVRLESMSTDEALLSIRRLDAARHVLAEARVSRGRYLRDHYFLDRVSVTFELDPSQLPDAVRGFAALIGEMELP